MCIPLLSPSSYVPWNAGREDPHYAALFSPPPRPVTSPLPGPNILLTEGVSANTLKVCE
jgi:hypothetical protein